MSRFSFYSISEKTKKHNDILSFQGKQQKDASAWDASFRLFTYHIVTQLKHIDAGQQEQRPESVAKEGTRNNPAKIGAFIAAP